MKTRVSGGWLLDMVGSGAFLLLNTGNTGACDTLFILQVDAGDKEHPIHLHDPAYPERLEMVGKTLEWDAATCRYVFTSGTGEDYECFVLRKHFYNPATGK